MNSTKTKLGDIIIDGKYIDFNRNMTVKNTMENCGGKKGKGGCANWAGATEGLTTIKIAY